MTDHDLFAMDTCFRHRWGTYPLEARCAMLSDLGYDATYLTLFDPSDPAGDDAAAATLGRICDRADEHDVSVLLYPHVGNWLERVEDAARLCDRLDRDNLGAAFCGFSFDNFALLGLLERAGYDAPIGVQGFGVGGDVYAVLDRSLSALEGMLDRLDRRPNWASIDFDRTTP